MCGMRLLIHSKIQPFKFRKGYVISSCTCKIRFLYNVVILRGLRFKSSYAFLNPPPPPPPPHPPTPPPTHTHLFNDNPVFVSSLWWRFTGSCIMGNNISIKDKTKNCDPSARIISIFIVQSWIVRLHQYCHFRQIQSHIAINFFVCI